jgi:outer membrane biosynthesis protein TonB
MHEGEVTVRVSLGIRSEVTGVEIAHSSNPNLNVDALQAARLSRYHTSIVKCRPQPAMYVMTIALTPQGFQVR